ncbi:MAG TPA: ribonuclease D [Phnomibacter sp.]|nr:ribonuclease D [Phnomibacter sp.]
MKTPLRYITSQPALEECISSLQQATIVAFDLEFDRDRFTYGFDLCLVQIATPSECFVIDPIAPLELSGLFRVFENNAIKKLVYCPGEDLRLLHSLQCYPTQLVDCEVYAKLLNYEQTSLSNMLNITSGFSLNKKLQTSNWGKRPLTEAQLEYAAADVWYLFQLEETLRKEATEKNVLHMAEEEFSQLNETRYTLEPKQNYIKKNDRQFMSPFDQYLLNELFKYRDQLARSKNKPAHYILPESVLRLLAYKKISVEEIALQKGIHPMLRTERELTALAKRWDAIHEEAKSANLSRRKEGQTYSEEERQAFDQKKQQLEEAKTKVFQPIQQWIGAKLGEHTMRYLFSSTLIQDVLRGETKLSSLKPAYRAALVQEAANASGHDISKWW